MPYEKKISRAEPGFIGTMVDESQSMSDPMLGTSDSKYLWTERYYGHVLKELLARSTDMKGDTPVIKPRYYLSHILYGSQPCFWGDEIMDIRQSVEKYTQDGNSLKLGGHLGGTDTAAAYQKAHEVIQRVVADERFAKSFPPTLFHLTDGESQTDALPIAKQIQELSTSDGNVLIVNAYIGTQTNLCYHGPEDFPGYVDAAEAGGTKDNLRLFQMSSEMPECIYRNLVGDGIFPKLRPRARLFFDVRTKEMLKHVLQVVGSLGSRADRQER